MTDAPQVILQTTWWKSSRDDSRPAGDSPAEGDYIITGNRVYKVIEATHSKVDRFAWSLKCEPAGGWEPWKNDPNPDYTIFDWEWRTNGAAFKGIQVIAREALDGNIAERDDESEDSALREGIRNPGAGFSPPLKDSTSVSDRARRLRTHGPDNTKEEVNGNG